MRDATSTSTSRAKEKTHVCLLQSRANLEQQQCNLQCECVRVLCEKKKNYTRQLYYLKWEKYKYCTTHLLPSERKVVALHVQMLEYHCSYITV